MHTAVWGSTLFWTVLLAALKMTNVIGVPWWVVLLPFETILILMILLVSLLPLLRSLRPYRKIK